MKVVVEVVDVVGVLVVVLLSSRCSSESSGNGGTRCRCRCGRSSNGCSRCSSSGSVGSMRSGSRRGIHTHLATQIGHTVFTPLIHCLHDNLSMTNRSTMRPESTISPSYRTMYRIRYIRGRTIYIVNNIQ